MKELSTEEKAKRYDEALERAREWYNDPHITIRLKGNLENIFPELKESEDERIRKAILDYMTIMWGNSQDDVCGVHVEDAIAWLEKQGEQKNFASIEPKFKDGDVLYSPCLKLLWIYKSRDAVYCGCNLNYNDGAFCGEGYFERPTDAIPATKEQCDTLMKAMADAGFTFDFEKKELKKIESNPAWSKEDEARFNSCIRLLQTSDEYDTINAKWLKSLKDRVKG